MQPPHKLDFIKTDGKRSIFPHIWAGLLILNLNENISNETFIGENKNVIFLFSFSKTKFAEYCITHLMPDSMNDLPISSVSRPRYTWSVCYSQVPQPTFKSGWDPV